MQSRVLDRELSIWVGFWSKKERQVLEKSRQIFTRRGRRGQRKQTQQFILLEIQEKNVDKLYSL